MSAVASKTLQLGVAVGSAAQRRTMQAVDRQITPRRRSEIYNSARAWITQNPRLAAFLLTHLALSGLPVLVFLTFSTTVLVSAVATCVAIALVTALSFTAFVVGGALFIFVPTVFVTSLMATTVFFWGMVALVSLQWLQRLRAKAPSAHDVERSVRSSIRELEKDTVALENNAINKVNGIAREKKSGYEDATSPVMNKSDSVALKDDILASTQKPLTPGKPSTSVSVDDAHMKDKWTNYLEQAEKTVKPQSSTAIQPLDHANGVSNGNRNGTANQAPSVDGSYHLTSTQNNKENLTDTLDNNVAASNPSSFAWSGNQQQANVYAGSTHAYRSS